MPKLPLYPISVLAIIAVGSYLGCNPGSIIPDVDKSAETQAQSDEQIASSDNKPTGKPVSLQSNRGTLPDRTRDTILVASFNIQVFGESKLSDTWCMERLAEVIRQFDVVAIQEIRATNQELIPSFLKRFVNSIQGVRYDYLLGPRLGRTASKEQYAYVYDTTRISTSPDTSYTVVDEPQDLLHREPLVGRFVTKISGNQRPFTFSLCNIHTDPDEKAELDVLDDVYRSVRAFEYQNAREDDLILLGDFNESPNRFGDLGKIPALRPVINSPTTPRGTKLLDNILVDLQSTNEFTGRSGVLDLAEYYSLKLNDVEKLSDHYPVWAEFRIQEQQPGDIQMATQPTRPIR